MTRFKFAKGTRVRPTRWLDCGAPKGVSADATGVVVARTPAKDSLENRNYYTVRFPNFGAVEIAEDELAFDNVLDDFVDKIR